MEAEPVADGVSRARRDIIAGAALLAATAALVWLAARFAPPVHRILAGMPGAHDRMLVAALCLNLALALFGWRRYRDLKTARSGQATAEARASTLAARDALTGFLNRRSLGEAASALLARAERRQKQVALLVVDLDSFRTINDVHGHKSGDALLGAVAARIARALPPSAEAARLDGDAFAIILLFDPLHGGAIDALAEHLVSRLAQPLEAGEVQVHISASVGIARSDADCGTVDALMRRAFIAVRQAKARGRNRHIWFDAGMERELIARSAVESGLRDGIPRGQFVPYYEQQVDLRTGQLHGFEVLARWEHPVHGLVPPDSFIPVAEESGLIADLSLAVMRRAFSDARDWDPSLSLSVNISPAQLKDPWLAQKIVKLLVETGFPANRLEVEITETALFDNLNVAQSIVGSLKNQGIRLALDDFGTGYSSLSHLRALPFDRIKIDRSFVTSINENPESAAIVNAITSLGESLGLPITAEGIENEAVRARLQALGCAKGQGWHFGKPLGIGPTRRLLAERGLLPLARGPAGGEDLRQVGRAG